MHPSLPKPRARHENPVFMDISSLEKSPDAVEIINSMKRYGTELPGFVDFMTCY